MKINRRDLLAWPRPACGGRGLRIRRPVARPSRRSRATRPKTGASLRLLRWSPFVQGDEDAWLANTKKFTEATGVEVRVDKESWEDIRPKAAVAANVGSGPDLMLVLVRRSAPISRQAARRDRSRQLSRCDKYGGWYDGPKGYATRDDKFIALPLAAIGNAIVLSRQPGRRQRASANSRRTPPGFLELCKAHEGQGHAGRLRAWQGGRRRQQLRALAAVEPWRQDGRRERRGRDQQPRDARGDRTTPRSSTRPSFPAPRAGSTSTTTAPSSPARCRSPPTASRSTTPRKKDREAGRDGRRHPHHQLARSVPVGQVASNCTRPRRRSSFNHTKYPERRKAYLQFMFEAEQMNAWITGLQRLLLPAAQGLRRQPGLDRRSRSTRPMRRRRRRCARTAMPGRSAMPRPRVMADYVLVDMFAEAVTGASNAGGSDRRRPRSAPTATTV